MGEHASLESAAAVVLVVTGAIAVVGAWWRARRFSRAQPPYIPAPLDRGTAVRATWAMAIAASAGAGVIHIGLAPEHVLESSLLGLGFILAGALQLAWSGLALVTRSRGIALAAIIGNVLLIAAWATSRTVGLPIGEEPWVPEAIGRADLIAIALETIVIAALFVVSLGWLRKLESDLVVDATSIAVVPIVGLIAVATVLALSSPSDHATHHHGDTGRTDLSTHRSGAVLQAGHPAEERA